MIEQGIQSNFHVEALKNYGCHFFSLMKFLEVKRGFNFTKKRLADIYEEACTLGFMDGECNVLNAIGLLNYVLEETAYHTYRRDLKERPDVDVCIIRKTKTFNDGSFGTHFLLDINGATFDPCDPCRPAAVTWNFDSYREIM